MKKRVSKELTKLEGYENIIANFTDMVEYTKQKVREQLELYFKENSDFHIHSSRVKDKMWEFEHAQEELEKVIKKYSPLITQEKATRDALE